MMKATGKPEFPFIVSAEKAEDFLRIVNEKQEKNLFSAIAKSEAKLKKLMERKCSSTFKK